MTKALVADIGAKVVRGIPPESVSEHAHWLASTLDELWIVEDCFYAGGISQLGVVLEATGETPVGHGIAPAPFRNAAALAMEWATLARLYPGRLRCGLGHGVPEWMHQIGAETESPMALLRETIECVTRLLRGEMVSFRGEVLYLDEVGLEYPPDRVPPVSLGVRGPNSLRLAGEVADGAVLAEWSSPSYVEWARARMDEGRLQAGRSDPYRLTVFVGFCFADDSDAMATTAGAAKDFLGQNGMLNMIWPEGRDQPHELSPQGVMEAGLAIGSSEDIASYLRALADAGADALVMEPMASPVAQLERFINEVLPLLGWPAEAESP